jgi:hypothetical protein
MTKIDFMNYSYETHACCISQGLGESYKVIDLAQMQVAPRGKTGA